MQLNLTFRNLEPTESLKNHVRETLDRLSKYLDHAGVGQVVLSAERHLYQVDIGLRSGAWQFRGHDKSEDVYVSVEVAVDRLERQIVRMKDRVKQHHAPEAVHHRYEMLQPL